MEENLVVKSVIIKVEVVVKEKILGELTKYSPVGAKTKSRSNHISNG